MRSLHPSVRHASLWLSPLLVVGLAAAGAPPSTGDVAATRVSAAPAVHHCYGKVVRVEDGDTVDIRLTKSCVDGARGSLMVIRNAGIQTTEHNNGNLECWAAEAERHFRHLLFKGRHVRTTSYYTTKSDRVTPQGRVRLIKYVDAARKGGKWLDVQNDQVLHGLAMAKPEDRESMRNAKMVYAMERAMRSKLGMWGSPQHCGTHHYAPNARIRGWIGWKVDGPDGKDFNGEWLRFRNVGSTTINLARWKLRSSSHDLGGGPNKTYVPLPSGAKLAPGDTMTVYPGNGTDSVTKMKFYLNLPRLPFFRNVPMPYGETVPGTHLPTGQAWP
ncbi:MAG: hypothetical protein QOJ03_1619, partial [Frankiaceae bacterium]|nr:hypothetical protein [Frankiaceae bacterium]